MTYSKIIITDNTRPIRSGYVPSNYIDTKQRFDGVFYNASKSDFEYFFTYYLKPAIRKFLRKLTKIFSS